MDNATDSMEPVIVTHKNTHQNRFSRYISASTSSGLCASNFLRIAFTHYLDGTRDNSLYGALTRRNTFMDISDIAQHYQRTNHLEVIELVGAPSYHPIVGSPFTVPPKTGLPYFTWWLDTRDLEPIRNYKCTKETFDDIMQRLDEITSPISGVIITGTSKNLSVLKMPLQLSRTGKIFIVYDSHVHQELYPDGAGMVIYTQREHATAFLTKCFKPNFYSIDDGIDASFVTPRWLPHFLEKDRPLKDKVLLEASMQILHLRYDMYELKDKLFMSTLRRYRSSQYSLEWDQESLPNAMTSRSTQENVDLEAILAGMQDAINPVRLTEKALDAEKLVFQQQRHQKQRQQPITMGKPTDVPAGNLESTTYNEKITTRYGASALVSIQAQHEADEARTESTHQIDRATDTAAPVGKTRSVCAVLHRALQRLCAPFHRQSRVEKASVSQSGAAENDGRKATPTLPCTLNDMSREK